MQSEKHDVANPPTKRSGTITIQQLMGFQLRIALALIVVVPFVYEIQRYWDRLFPSAYVWFAITFVVPVVALIFLANPKTMLWMVSLIFITSAGGAIGFFTSYLVFPNATANDRLLLSAIPAILFWVAAVRLKHRRSKLMSSGEIVG